MLRQFAPIVTSKKNEGVIQTGTHGCLFVHLYQCSLSQSTPLPWMPPKGPQEPNTRSYKRRNKDQVPKFCIKSRNTLTLKSLDKFRWYKMPTTHPAPFATRITCSHHSAHMACQSGVTTLNLEPKQDCTTQMSGRKQAVLKSES